MARARMLSWRPRAECVPIETLQGGASAIGRSCRINTTSGDTARCRGAVILRAFVKKTEKTPTGEIDMAWQRTKAEAKTKISELHRRWTEDTDYKDACDALGEEFDLARTLIEARRAAACRRRNWPGA